MDFETIGSIVAIFIGICALGISIWQGIEMRKNYRLSVTPNISINLLLITNFEQPGMFIIFNKESDQQL